MHAYTRFSPGFPGIVGNWGNTLSTRYRLIVGSDIMHANSVTARSQLLDILGITLISTTLGTIVQLTGP